MVIIPNETKDNGLDVTKHLINVLKDRANIYMNKSFEWKITNVFHIEEKELFDNADCVIVLGGDGTILRVAEPCGKKNIPVMGINLGKVGFMTEIKVEEIGEACSALLSDNYIIEKRMMMSISIVKNSKVCGHFHALNDIVLSKDKASMILVKMYANNEKVNQYKADGLIISTPTGSTGYSLSAGGPVVDPMTQLFVASPICAHELHARPAVLSAEKPITLTLDGELGHDALVTVDGDVKESITVSDKVIIEKSKYSVGIIKIGKQSFYDVLIDKLR